LGGLWAIGWAWRNCRSHSFRRTLLTLQTCAA